MRKKYLLSEVGIIVGYLPCLASTQSFYFADAFCNHHQTYFLITLLKLLLWLLIN